MEAGSATGHNYTSTVVAPTEDSYGYTLYTCVTCGESYKDNFVNHEHSYDTVTVVPPTCTENGYTLHECECGHSYQDAETDYIGHDIVLGKDPATRMPCYECTRCDFSYTLKHTQTYSLRGRSQRILESTTVEEYSYVYTGGSLMQMVLKTTTTPVDGSTTTTTETLNFTYDASGTPLSVKFSGTDYYYVTNIQGDIMAILNTSGEPVVQYNYDAWGKLHSFFGSMEDTLGEVNPLTYRGYVYDNDSGYYYLQSRYYDPEVGRFINADGLVATGQGILGNNMFAYCNDCPVFFKDTTGSAPWPTTVAISECRTLPFGAADTMKSFWHMQEKSAKAQAMWNELCNLKPTEDASKVLEAEYFALYKGALVVKVPSDKKAAFSCGVIFISNKVNNENLVRHEYGHVEQLKKLGISRYTTTVVLPSVICFYLDEAGWLPENSYYNLPWEYKADEEGGVTWQHSQNAKFFSDLYWLITSP